MKILMISSYLPYPLYSGGQVRLYNLIRELSVNHEITLICEKRQNQTIEDIQEVEKICKKVITVNRRKQWSFGNILRSGFSCASFLVTGHTHAQMHALIEQELQNSKHDLIHVETYYVMQNLFETTTWKESLRNTFQVSESLLRGGRKDSSDGVAQLPYRDTFQVADRTPGRWTCPIVLAEHNIEYQVYKKFADRLPFLLRPLLSLDIAKIHKEEELCWEKANALIAVSEEDKRVMELAGLKPYLVSNGVNTDQFSFGSFEKRGETKERKILFIGDFKWIQNQDSIKFIIREIWPKIDSRLRGNDNIKLWIVARDIPDSIRQLTDDPNVLFDQKSSAKPTPEIFQEASVLLAPIRVGGGTSYKILESMSCGTPVVTMQMSADAISAKDGEDLMIGQTAEVLAEKTLELLTDNSLYIKVSKNGRKLIEDNYTWKQISKKLEEVYRETKKKSSD